MSIEKNVIKYPKDIFTSQTKTATFSIESRLSTRKMGEKNTQTNEREYAESPLRILSEFSGYKFSIVDSDGINSNLSIKDLHKLTRRSEFAYNKALELENKTEDNPQNCSPAFTVRFRMGTLKGKTPIDVLLENGKEKGSEILNKQFAFLKESSQNNPKYASGNKEIMDAIKDAASIDLSTLDNKSVLSVKPIMVIDTGMKGSYRSKQDENGMHLCSQIQVLWDFNNDYPVTVTLMNLRCPIIPPKDGGGQLLKLSEAKDRKMKSFNFTADDFMDAVHQMNADLNYFNQINYKKAYDLSNEALFANMKKD